MNITLTQDEYKLLMDMVAISDWILNAHATHPDDGHPEYEALKWKIFSYANSEGLGARIEHEPETLEYYETMDYERYIEEHYIRSYDEKLFWDQLTEQLGERDLVNLLGHEHVKTLNPIERLRQIDELKERYIKEFAQNGLANLKLPT